MRILTHNFSKQQAKRFLACWDRQNDLLSICKKIYASKMKTFGAAPQASSRCYMNGYVSENSVFSFCPATIPAAK